MNYNCLIIIWTGKYIFVSFLFIYVSKYFHEALHKVQYPS